LAEIIEKLDVEKRRIYDVVNILEAFKVIFRTEKNCYQWCGLDSIKDTISKYEAGQPVRTSPEVQKLFKAKGNKKKMLTDLSGAFIKFFLKRKQTVTLEDAAEVFCEPNASASKIKTKVRRLYDISNVFLALGIVEKTFRASRKPAFTWIGLKGYLKVHDKLLTPAPQNKHFAMPTTKKSDPKTHVYTDQRTHESRRKAKL